MSDERAGWVAALHDEAGDVAVKNCVVIVARSSKRQEILPSKHRVAHGCMNVANDSRQEGERRREERAPQQRMESPHRKAQP